MNITLNNHIKKLEKLLLEKYGKLTNTLNIEKITYHLNKSIGQLNQSEIFDLVQLNKLYGDRLLKNLQDASAEKYYTIAINLYNEYSIENISLLEKLYFSK